MCCGACLLFICKIADSFLTTQKEKNEKRLCKRAADLRNKYAAAKSSEDPYSTGDDYVDSSDSESDDEREREKQKLE